MNSHGKKLPEALGMTRVKVSVRWVPRSSRVKRHFFYSL